MTKTYRSDTSISVNVLLPSGGSMHIPFHTHSNGSSTYVTADADIQAALEKHSRFNGLFRLAGAVDETAAEQKAEVPEEKGKDTVKVSDMAAAKDYLAERYGVSRTLMKSNRSILDQAASHGIEFEFADRK